MCQNSVKINELPRGRLRSDRPAPLYAAEQESVKYINLNITHAWGTPHKENKPAHPCISWGRYGVLRKRGWMGEHFRLSSQETWCGPQKVKTQTGKVCTIEPETVRSLLDHIIICARGMSDKADGGTSQMVTSREQHVSLWQRNNVCLSHIFV